MTVPVPEGAQCFFEDCTLPPVSWAPSPVAFVLEDDEGAVVRTFEVGEADVALCTTHLEGTDMNKARN